MNPTFRIFALLFMLTFSSFVSLAQPGSPAPKEDFWDRVYFGGNFGLQFGDQTLVDINPLMGYRLTDQLSVGFSVTYLYYKFTDPYNVYPDYSTDIYGGSIFTRYYFLENIFAHVEGEVLNLEVPNYFLQKYVRKCIRFIRGRRLPPTAWRTVFTKHPLVIQPE